MRRLSATLTPLEIADQRLDAVLIDQSQRLLLRERRIAFRITEENLEPDLAARLGERLIHLPAGELDGGAIVWRGRAAGLIDDGADRDGGVGRLRRGRRREHQRRRGGA